MDCESRYSTVINGTSPGPTLYLQEGRTTWIRVYNYQAEQNGTVHWHGLSQRSAPFSDGTPQAAQWPIAPGEFFDYEVRPAIGDAGTYFYHSHVDFQAVSAHGAIVVEECGSQSYNYSGDLIAVLADYFPQPDASIVSGLLAPKFIWSGEVHSLLVNGQSGTTDFSNAIDSSCAPYIFNVEPDTTYRMRFIGATAISLITLGIEEHPNLTIIEADGGSTKPLITDHLQLGSGNRFSILFQTKSAEELLALNRTSFWIQLENRDRPTTVTNFALISYALPGIPPSHLPLPDVPPLTLPDEISGWLEYSIESNDPSLDPFPPASVVDRTILITVQQLFNGSFSSLITPGTIEWAQNGDVWQDTRVQVPYLVSIFENGEVAIPDYEAALNNNGWDPKTLAFPARIGEVVDIVWQNDNGPSGEWDSHPFHAHGRHYWDLGSGNGTYDADANNAYLEQLEAERGYVPTRRDTTLLYRYAANGVPETTAGWRAWRLNVSNAGVWMMHCHILQHMIMGMQTAWVFGDAEQITGDWPEPYVEGYLEYGGSAYGNSSYDPLVYEYYSHSAVDEGDCSC